MRNPLCVTLYFPYTHVFLCLCSTIGWITNIDFPVLTVNASRFTSQPNAALVFAHLSAALDSLHSKLLSCPFFPLWIFLSMPWAPPCTAFLTYSRHNPVAKERNSMFISVVEIITFRCSLIYNSIISQLTHDELKILSGKIHLIHWTSEFDGLVQYTLNTLKDSHWPTVEVM